MTAAGPGPIPWDKTVEYSDRSELDREASQAFVHIMRELDSAYIRWASARIKSATPKKPTLKAGKHARVQH